MLGWDIYFKDTELCEFLYLSDEIISDSYLPLISEL